MKKTKGISVFAQETYALILFDGLCHFCNQAVRWIIKHDRKRSFRFASLQSKTAESLFAAYQIPSACFNTIVLIEGDRYFTDSTAVLRICKRLDGVWKGLYVFLVIPQMIRDPLYQWFAKNRYKFFGKKEVCTVPAPEIRDRFLEEEEGKSSKPYP